MRYLSNLDNLVRTADVAVSAQLASQSLYRTDTDPKDGGGSVSLSGSYTGAADATFDVEVLDSAAANPVVTEPVFVGVGNGTMTSVSASGVDAQSVTVTLEDLGTETRKAYAPFQSVTLRAKTAGAGGNSISLTVSAAGITATASTYATQGEITAGSNEYAGEEWNFGAATLNPDGTIPSSAPRIRFGQDPQVYRPYRQFVDGRYVYGFSPAPVRNVPRGTRVYAVIGTYAVTITDGVTPQTHSSITTLYDCLSAIRSSSNLVDVDGVVVNDKLPGGQGVVDLSVWTDPYIVSIVGDGTDYVREAQIGLVASSTAPTELLTITCANTDEPGLERWQVRGEVSGTLAEAITGVLYESGAYRFTIPRIVVPAGQGSLMVEYKRPDNDGSAELAKLCVRNPMLGAAARNGRFVFEWRRRPRSVCDCSDATVVGGPSVDCLGIEPEEGGVVTDTARRRRLQRLADWVNGFVRTNTGKPSGAAASVDQDIAWADRAAGILSAVLAQITADADATVDYDEFTAWSTDTAFAVDDVVVPTTSNGYRYAATVAGSSHASSEPTWPTTVGDTVVDNGVTWENIGKLPFGMWDELFTLVQSDGAELQGFGAVPYYSSYAYGTQYARGQMMLIGGYLYLALNTGFTPPVVGEQGAWENEALPEDRFPTGVGEKYVEMIDIPGINSDEYPTETVPITWMCLGEAPELRANSTAYALRTRVVVEMPQSVNDPESEKVFGVMQCTTAGTSDSSAPTWPTEAGDTVSDGTVTWTRVGGDSSDIAPLDDAYFARYESFASAIVAAAGIDPDFDIASGQGDGCWRDFEPEYWFAPQDEESTRCPIQVGQYYHASRFRQDDDGTQESYSTQEWGFGPGFACPDNIQEGDQLIVTVSGVGGVLGYQAADRITAQILRGSALEFGGGQTGDDTLTWSVIGSVDGALDDYALDLTAPAAYSDGGIGFLITQGGIRFALGDQFTFSTEAPQFQWRKDGGSWSSATDIEDTVSLSDGLSAVFTGGRAPSWVDGDAWSFAAEAVNGPGNFRQPTPGAYRWTGATTITITPASADPVDGILIAEHTIPAGTTITIQGSDDNFSSTPLNTSTTAADGAIWVAISGDYAKYRLSIDVSSATAEIGWIWLGEALDMQIRTGLTELGRLTQRRRLPRPSVRAGLGVRVEHQALTSASVDALEGGLAHASEYDDGRLGIVLSDGTAALVEYQADSLEVEDVFGFQPTDATKRLNSVQLELAAVR